ncbi:MAG: hypothetical protein DGJ47_000191 [Rickettsiaceae bacterium]
MYLIKGCLFLAKKLYKSNIIYNKLAITLRYYKTILAKLN